MNDVLIAVGFFLMVLAPCFMALFSPREEELHDADEVLPGHADVNAAPVHER